MTHTKLCVDPLDKNRQIFNDQKQVLRKVSSNFVSIQIGASKYLKHMMVRASDQLSLLSSNFVSISIGASKYPTYDGEQLVLGKSDVQAKLALLLLKWKIWTEDQLSMGFWMRWSLVKSFGKLIGNYNSPYDWVQNLWLVSVERPHSKRLSADLTQFKKQWFVLHGFENVQYPQISCVVSKWDILTLDTNMITISTYFLTGCHPFFDCQNMFVLWTKSWRSEKGTDLCWVSLIKC